MPLPQWHDTGAAPRKRMTAGAQQQVRSRRHVSSRVQPAAERLGTGCPGRMQACRGRRAHVPDLHHLGENDEPAERVDGLREEDVGGRVAAHKVAGWRQR